MTTPRVQAAAGHDADAADAADRAWLRATAEHDRAAFECIYRRHHPRLARFLRRFTSRHDLIDDVVNDTMWVVWRQAGDFRGDSKVSTWVTGIAYRCMLKALRGRAGADAAVEPMPEGEEPAQHPTAMHDAREDIERRDWVARGLRTLPHDLRVTLELAYFLGQSCEEIAEIMGCAVGTVKARMFHARVRLRNVMPALGGTPSPCSAAQG